MRPRDRDDFGIAIICALPLEGDAVEVTFDEIYDERGHGYGKQHGDTNSYVTGRIGQHNVVLCYMPCMGGNSAASVASSLRLSYTSIKLALVVGICGGAPFPSGSQQIFLGDVIISDSVIQYDFGRQYPGGFKRKTGVNETLGRPSQEIRGFLAQAKGRRVRSKLETDIAESLRAFRQPKLRWHFPTSEDVLFDPSFVHKHRSETPSFHCACSSRDRPDEVCTKASEMSCDKLACDSRQVIRRKSIGEATTSGTAVHIGTIASADTVMKSGNDRDRLVRSEKVLGFEMEGAGVWDNISCIVIKGVCDYADSHKSKDWQHYAAAVGACAAKSFLSMWTPTQRNVLPGNPGIPSAPFFIGRSNELREIRTRLSESKAFNQIVVVHGLAGIGKSQLVAKHAAASLCFLDYSVIFWLDVSSPSHLASSFLAARERIDAHDNSTSSTERVQDGVSSINQHFQRHLKKGQSIEDWNAWDACAASENVDAVKRWLNKTRNKDWLLVFDNYPSSTNPSNDEQGPSIQKFLPEDRRGHVIITSQSSLPFGYNIRLGKITSQKEALDIFCGTAKREELREDTHALDLIDQMDGLPLALAAAGSYMSMIPSLKCLEYLELHKQGWYNVQQATPQVSSYNGKLYSCWAMTFKKLAMSQDVLRILMHWTCLDSQDVWFELFDPKGLIWPGISVTIFHSAMGLLVKFGIVECGSHPGSDSVGCCGYNMQRSFHAWLENKIRNLIPDISTISLATSAVTYCSQSLIKSGRYHKGLLRILPHANRCAELALTDTIDADIIDPIYLARVFLYAGYGKSESFAIFLAMMRLENPAKVHFITSETLLQHALRKIEQFSGLSTTPEAPDQIPNQRSLYLCKAIALLDLRILSKHKSDFSRRQTITSQLYTLHRDTNNEPEAQLEQENMRSESSFANDLRVFRRRAIIGGSILLLQIVLCLLLLEDGMDLLLFLALGFTFVGSWWIFMYNWRHRRKALVVMVLFSVPLAYQFRNFGPLMLLWLGYPFILMGLSTIPVLYYQGLSPATL
ncbi:unnamed protein product [Penicillium salamii]|uniref:Nucleoside phosphorylase domain-containing protein n=1 Tax=Penicillium salamii TaxID=1612424 RepID=A0A9W4K295_9EURO|nr:unnamed protein product [Penicillium salamii]